MTDRKINFQSWKTAASGFDGVATSAPSSLNQIISTTTNPEACEATGISTVDGAVAIVLTAFNALMTEIYAPGLEEGLSSEAHNLNVTGQDLQATEDANEASATEIEGWL